jgi:hypothetical protein
VSNVVYVEGLVGNLYLERPADLDRYRRVFDELRSRALSPERSAALIDKIGNEYRVPAPRHHAGG